MPGDTRLAESKRKYESARAKVEAARKHLDVAKEQKAAAFGNYEEASRLAKLAQFRVTATKTEQFPAAVIRHRKRARMSQADLAKVLGTTTQWVSILETTYRKPRARTLSKLAAALSCEVSDLWGQDEPEGT